MTDPVLRRREQLRTVADVGQKAGYGLFALAVVLFFAGLATEFPSWVVSLVVASLVVGSVLLAPAIVLGYAVKAADKEDAERAGPRASPPED